MSHRWLLSTLTFLLAGALLLLYSPRRAAVEALVEPLGLAVGEPLHYADSTDNAQHWYWEFGQGSSSTAQQGVFRYTHPGTYLVRLTLDGRRTRVFTVHVTPARVRHNLSIRLLGPRVGYPDEKLAFQALGTAARKFAWQFGESQQVDSHEAMAFYTYTKPGTYRVQLTTDVTQEPLVQQVQILARYQPPTPPAAPNTNDIKWRLQRIAKGQHVNRQYAYLLANYLCGKANTPVVAGSAPPTNFYAYCMDLQFDPHWVIDSVAVENSAASACLQKLIVTQHKEQ